MFKNVEDMLDWLENIVGFLSCRKLINFYQRNKKKVV